MGKYTARTDPRVDETVEHHLCQIVDAIRSRVEPESVVLRGSFSQGEGSVVVEDKRIEFLSDYEIVAITPHYAHRRWLQHVAAQMTRQLGVETSISRVHPYNIVRNSLGNLPYGGLARPSIAMYEMQHCGQTLYGDDWTHRGPAINPADLSPWTGLRLLLNRMAESLNRVPHAEKGWDELRWINKTILSCSEAVLIVNKRYHFSYAERGRRFAELAPRLETSGGNLKQFVDLVWRATAFKLCPACDLYPEPLPELWQTVRRMCDVTLRYVVDQYLGITFGDYHRFPARYLERWVCGPSKSELARKRAKENMLLAAKFLRARRVPPRGLVAERRLPIYQMVYSTVPLVFLEPGNSASAEAEQILARVGYGDQRKPLRDRTVKAWKDLCYGMWDAAGPEQA